MKWRNETPGHLTFQLGRQTYDVAPGGECDIPERLTYAVESRRLPLTPIEGSRAREASSLAQAFLAAFQGEPLEPPHGTSEEDIAALEQAAAFGRQFRERYVASEELEAARAQIADAEARLEQYAQVVRDEPPVQVVGQPTEGADPSARRGRHRPKDADEASSAIPNATCGKR